MEILHSLFLCSVTRAAEVHGWRRALLRIAPAIKETLPCSVGQPKQVEGLCTSRSVLFFPRARLSETDSFLR